MIRYNKIFPAIIFLLTFLTVYGQECQPGHIRLTSQFEIDDFALDYKGCTRINGSLSIIEDVARSITDLSGLSHITCIAGNLDIQFLRRLKNLDPFIGLDSVYGDIFISHCDSIESIEGLNGLEYIGGEFFIKKEGNIKMGLFQLDSLTRLEFQDIELPDMSAFSNLRKLGSLNTYSSYIGTLQGLNQLTEVNSISLSITDGFSTLQGLNNLESIGELAITDCESLSSMEGLEKLERITRNFRLSRNDNIASLTGLESIRFDSTDLILITYNPLLSECSIVPICESLSNPYLRFEIKDNGLNCKSFMEVSNVCLNDCPPGLYFYSQEDIDLFPVRFGECAFINGDIVIGGSYGNTIKNLDSLYGITGLSGNLSISGNKNLQNLSGLENLDSVGGNIEIIYNSSLTSISALQNINSTRDLIINENETLANLQGLDNLRRAENVTLITLKNTQGLEQLKTISGDLVIYGGTFTNINFPSLDSVYGKLSLERIDSVQVLDGFPSLVSIGGLELFTTPFKNLNGLNEITGIYGDLHVAYNYNLDSFGLNQVQQIEGSIRITQQELLQDFSLLQHLDYVQGDLILRGNRLVKDFSDLSKIRAIDGDCEISSHGLVNSLSSLGNIEQIGGSLTIRSMHAIETLHGLEKLVFIGDSLRISNNEDLISFDGLSSLSSVGKIRIADNLSLVNIDKLESVSELRGGIKIEMNPELLKVFSLENFNTVHGDLILNSNYALKSIAELDSIRTIEGELLIHSTPLQTFNGLQNLSYIGKGLTIDGTYAANLDLLENLKVINGPLVINSNQILQNLNGLRNVDPKSIYAKPFNEDIVITNNPSLADCSIEPVCEALLSTGKLVRVEGNYDGCYDNANLELQCWGPESCPTFNIALSTQSQVDNFNITHPGCGIIRGFVLIEEAFSGAITNLDSLYTIHTIFGSLKIRGNDQLEDLHGLEGLEKIYEGIEINNNDLLSRIDALENIEPDYIGKIATAYDDLIITNNPVLEECSISFVCELLRHTSINKAISENGPGCNSEQIVRGSCAYPSTCKFGQITKQVTIDEFPILYAGCTELRSGLDIYGEQIFDLSPLLQLTTIRGLLEIQHTDDLITLSGLQQISEIHGPVILIGNDKLSNIEALSHIEPTSIRYTIYDDNIVIRFNDSLSNCAIEPVCELLSIPGTRFDIRENLSSCNSREEIKSQCLVSVSPSDDLMDVRLYPNPTSGEVNIFINPGAGNQIEAINVYDSMGKRLSSEKFSSTFSLDGFPSGLYTVVLSTHDGQFISARILLMQ